MRRQAMLVVGLFIIFATTVFAQVKPIAACGLLTASEIETAVGAAGPAQESDMPIDKGPSKGQTMATCSWRLRDGGIHISVVRATTGPDREASLAKLDQMFQLLKGQGWEQQTQKFSNGQCTLMTPPAAKKDAPNSTGCFAEAKGMTVSLAAVGRTSIPIDKVKPLLDRALMRLP